MFSSDASSWMDSFTLSDQTVSGICVWKSVINPTHDLTNQAKAHDGSVMGLKA